MVSLKITDDLDQYIYDMKNDLAEVKKETAGVMAQEARTKRLVDENQAEMDRYENLAAKALQAGNEEDARVFLAKTQEKLNEVGAAAERARGAGDVFSRMEEKADRMLDEANAMNQLNTEPVDEASALEEKYASQNQSAAVDEELAKLKSKLGL